MFIIHRLLCGTTEQRFAPLARKNIIFLSRIIIYGFLILRNIFFLSRIFVPDFLV